MRRRPPELGLAVASQGLSCLACIAAHAPTVLPSRAASDPAPACNRYCHCLVGVEGSELVAAVCNQPVQCDVLTALSRVSADSHRYCHYVAGIVGFGLSRLFSASQWERPDMGDQDALSNHMGLFLQKTNIIRDYLEDISEVRRNWAVSRHCLHRAFNALKH